jgi:hypothetical protein
MLPCYRRAAPDNLYAAACCQLHVRARRVVVATELTRTINAQLNGVIAVAPGHAHTSQSPRLPRFYPQGVQGVRRERPLQAQRHSARDTHFALGPIVRAQFVAAGRIGWRDDPALRPGTAGTIDTPEQPIYAVNSDNH